MINSKEHIEGIRARYKGTDLTPKYDVLPASEILVIPNAVNLGEEGVGGMTANASVFSKGNGNDILKATSLGIWLGAAEFDDAPFSVNMAGVLNATSGHFSGDITGASGTFSGTITATTGAIGGFDIGSDYIRDTANSFGLASTVTVGEDVRFWAGNTYANRGAAPLRIYDNGKIFSSDAIELGDPGLPGEINLRNGSFLQILNDGAARSNFIFYDNDLEEGVAMFEMYLEQTSGSFVIDSNLGYPIVLKGGTSAAELRFLEPSGSGTNYTGFKAQAQSADITYTLPATVGAANTVLTDAAGNGILSWVAGVTASSTTTFTNKRITRRVVTVTQSANPTINTDNTDIASITALAQAISSMTTNLSGTPVAGDSLIIEITDDGSSRNITWGASFEASTVALPVTTVNNAKLTVGFFWNAASSKWRCIASA